MENKFYIYTGSAITRNAMVSSFSGWLIEKDARKAEASALLTTYERYPAANGYYNQQVYVQEYDFELIKRGMES
jgi:hypothetical protein